MQRLLDQSAVACRARGAAFFWLLAGFARGPGGSLPRKGLARSPACSSFCFSHLSCGYVTCAPARARGAAVLLALFFSWWGLGRCALKGQR